MEMMRVFYNSPAVLSNGSDEIFARDIEGCISDNPYVEGYMFEQDGAVQGYGIRPSTAGSASGWRIFISRRNTAALALAASLLIT